MASVGLSEIELQQAERVRKLKTSFAYLDALRASKNLVKQDLESKKRRSASGEKKQPAQRLPLATRTRGMVSSETANKAAACAFAEAASKLPGLQQMSAAQQDAWKKGLDQIKGDPAFGGALLGDRRDADRAPKLLHGYDSLSFSAMLDLARTVDRLRDGGACLNTYLQSQRQWQCMV